MGYPMARNLARAGHQVAVWSHTASKARQLASEEKAIACASPKQVAEQADYRLRLRRRHAHVGRSVRRTERRY